MAPVGRWTKRAKAVTVIVTPEILRASMPRCNHVNAWSEAFNYALDDFPVKDVAMLLAQVGHESQDLNHLQENLNYSAKRLVQVWPHRYPTLEAAAPYARNPEALANHTYGGRNGNTAPGDGWKYRGRGPIMITGKANYADLDEDSGLPVLEYPDLLSGDYGAGAIAACHYFVTRVTAQTIEGVTRQVQGGQLGLADRRERYNRTLRAILNRR